MTARWTWARWSPVHARRWARDIRLLLVRTVSEYSDDHCPQLSASISYYVLFSAVPLAIFLTGVSGLFLQDDRLRAQVIDALLSTLPVVEAEGRTQLNDAFDGMNAGSSLATLGGLAGLLWSASGMMGAIRFALNETWDVDYRRPLVTGKLVDLLMVVGVGVLLTASIAVTIVLQVARRLSADLAKTFGAFGQGATLGVELAALLVPFALSFLMFLFILLLVPSVKTRFSYVWPGALLSAILFELLKNGFALYVGNFSNYDAVYGSLGAMIASLFFVYLSANALLLGAEMAAEYPRVTHGLYDAQASPEPPRATPSLSRLIRSLFRSDERAPEHLPNAESLAAQRGTRIRDEIAGRSTGPE